MIERSATEQELFLMRPGVPSHIRRGVGDGESQNDWNHPIGFNQISIPKSNHHGFDCESLRDNHDFSASLWLCKIRGLAVLSIDMTDKRLFCYFLSVSENEPRGHRDLSLELVPRQLKWQSLYLCDPRPASVWPF
jgi:hypothetical protein